MAKPKIIQKLEQSLQVALKEVNHDAEVIDRSESFSINTKGEIIGLNLDYTSISNLEIIKNLKDLEILSLRQTKVSEISVLKHLTKLRIVVLLIGSVRMMR